MNSLVLVGPFKGYSNYSSYVKHMSRYYKMYSEMYIGNFR